MLMKNSEQNAANGRIKLGTRVSPRKLRFVRTLDVSLTTVNNQQDLGFQRCPRTSTVRMNHRTEAARPIVAMFGCWFPFVSLGMRSDEFFSDCLTIRV